MNFFSFSLARDFAVDVLVAKGILLKKSFGAAEETKLPGKVLLRESWF